MGHSDIHFAQDLTDCFSAEIGDGGLETAVFDRYLSLTEGAVDRIRAAHAAGDLPLLDLPRQRDDLGEIMAVADRFRSSFDDVVVLGTGGSSLGGQTLCSLADTGFGPRDGAPRIHFMDNVDPHTFEGLIGGVDWKRTGVIAISKSGRKNNRTERAGI